MRERAFFGFDFMLLGSVLILITVGILFIYSSAIDSDGQLVSNEYVKQIVWAAMGVVLLFVVTFVDYSKYRDYAIQIFLVMVILLAITLLFGRRVNGARSWLGITSLGLGIQPSEFAKISLIFLLARYFERNKQSIGTLRTFAVGFGFMSVFMGMVIIQPDMGTALVYVPIFLMMSFAAGAKKRHVLFVLVVGAISLVLAVVPAWSEYFASKSQGLAALFSETDNLLIILGVSAVIATISALGYFAMKRRYFYWLMYSSVTVLTGILGSVAGRTVLRDYQIKRLIIFLDPYIDPRGDGWNIIQSITAVGSGGLVGRGFLQGTQSHYRYLPQQSTDFIFSIISEELGFLGNFFVFVLYSVILIRGVDISIKSKDEFARFAGFGVIGMLFFHMVVNIGMTVGLMPITGIPLFFLSYGGSGLWTAIISVGLLLNIHMRRYKYS